MVKKIHILTAAFMLLTPTVSYTEVQNTAREPQDRSIPESDSTKIFFNRVTKRMSMPDDPKIVLVGWDTGQTSQFIAEKIDDAQVVNYLLDPQHIEYAELTYSHPRVQIIPGDLMRTDRMLRDKADMVFSSWVVGLIPEDRQVVSLKSMRFMLKEGGTCAVIFPMKGSAFSKVLDEVVSRDKWSKKFSRLKVSGRASYRPDQYANLMTRAGFKDVKAEKHVYGINFNDRAEFEHFVNTGLSRYKPYLNEEECTQLMHEVADEYMALHNVAPNGQVPYSVDMVVATAVK